MRMRSDMALFPLVAGCLGDAGAERVLGMLEIGAGTGGRGQGVSRATFAMALAAVLLGDLLDRSHNSAAYVRWRQASGHKVRFDHGALRTVRFIEGGTGALPGGIDAFARILAPLGYEAAGEYPLPRLRMHGQAWRHRDLPDAIPQFFVSELRVGEFDEGFGTVARRVFGGTRDPLDDAAREGLTLLERHGDAPLEVALAALPAIAGAFGRHHPVPDHGDYLRLLEQSAEAAWIATEGNCFNHATDRVDDVNALVAGLRQEGLPVKERIEVSSTGRVRQTALRADMVRRTFADGHARDVPGSFCEFIARDIDPESGGPDLSFDSGNATGIFAMTRAG